MKLRGLPPIPTLRRLDDDNIYVFPERHAHLGYRTVEDQMRAAIAGPFPDRYAAGYWLVGHLETMLTASQRLLWAEAFAQAGGLDAHYGQLIYLATIIALNKPPEYVLRCARPLPK